VGTARDGGALVALVPECRPEVVILDLTMPVLSGFEVLRALAPGSPNTRFLVLTMHTDRGYVREAFAAGAHGYLIKGARPEELSEAVWACCAASGSSARSSASAWTGWSPTPGRRPATARAR
jgi:DNA-binding NarL/FixJ family response regulator